MRINNPRLFNGDLLATYSKLAQMFGLTYDEITKGWTGTIDINRIPVSDLINKDITGYINAGNLLVGDLSGITFEQLTNITSGVTILSALNIIDEKFESQQNAINAVKQYQVAEGGLINVVSATIEDQVTGIKTDTFTVSVDQAELSGKFKLEKLTTDSDPDYASQYKLTYNGQQIGTTTIDIPKDQFLSGAQYIPSSETLQFTFAINKKDETTGEVTTTPHIVEVPVSGLVDEYSNGNGIQIEDNVDGKNIISIKLNNSDDNKFINLTADGLGLSGITAAITGAVDGANYAQIVNLPSGYTAVASSIVTYIETENAETSKNTLFVDTNGQTALYFAAPDDDTPSSIVDISQEYITESSDVTSGNFERLMTVKATSGYVAEQIQKAVFNDPDAAGLVAATRVSTIISSSVAPSGIPTIGAVSSYVAGEVDAVNETVKTEIEPKAIEMLEVISGFGTVAGAEPVSAAVSGRVIAVYDGNDDQVYPTIKYNKENGTSTLFADYPSAEYTIIYAKRIGQGNGSLPPYVQIPAQPENGESTEG